MDRYTLGHTIGSGASADVVEASTVSGERVAIKRLKRKFTHWEDCVNLSEVATLRCATHPNIIKLREVIREGDMLFLVFEHCASNLLGCMREMQRPMRSDEVRLVMFQVFSALRYIHELGMIHRDVKPENILCDDLESVKLADFSSARHQAEQQSPYVTTRWYRAPEVLLQLPYTDKIDLWAAGVMMAELFMNRPLFPGSSDTDQLFKQCAILGTPSSSSWSAGHAQATRLNIKLSALQATPLQLFMPDAPASAVDLIDSLLRFNHEDRCSAQDALAHKFFTE